MLKDPEKTLAEQLIALCKEQWETIRYVLEVEPKIVPRSRIQLPSSLADLTVSELNGAEPSILSRARTTKHFPTLPTNKRRDKVQELFSKQWLSREKLVLGVRKAFSLTNYPKYKDGGDVLTGLVTKDFYLIKKSDALEETTGLNGDAEYRLIPGAKVNWTKK